MRKFEEAKLSCQHCGGVFQPSIGQYERHRATRATNFFCSKTCQQASLSIKFSTPIPNRGPCPTCGMTFFSRRDKAFCSMKCYTGSAQFKEMRIATDDRRRRQEVRPCLECGVNVFEKKAEAAKKFCCKVCYRAYMAKRFDRWVANPEGMALPQCYDEFLDRDELPCIVNGCDWVGVHLTIHVNAMHGVASDEFKRAAGFNLSTGVVGKSLAEVFQSRSHVGVALDKQQQEEARQLAHETLKECGYVRYRSLEGAEHMRKARALRSLYAATNYPMAENSLGLESDAAPLDKQ